ncbi:MAG TPA: DUF5666 domain-containing protein [Longimicrobiaceae bacterium]|nr:DUF5666 domain-containing protein [Longimicrobiaceae bacterium]
MRQWIRAARGAPILLLLTAAGCAGGLGNLGNVLGGLGGAGGTGLTGEVQQVDTGRQQIWLATQSGQSTAVDYDSRTTVVYQQQQYPVTSLDRGDVVSVVTQQESNGALYASEIDVQQTVQERTGSGTVGGTGQLQQFTGRVGQIDQQNGWFQLQTNNGTYTVTLPYNPSTATLDYFRRLRTGDSVRVEGALLAQGRIELSRFM